jgi:outer membrane protein OmpA-like peptidoglycan-associated protein
LAFGFNAMSQSTVLYPLPCNNQEGVFGIGIKNHGLMYTSLCKNSPFIQHLDSSGHTGTCIYIANDTSTADVHTLSELPQSHLNESCPQYIPEKDMYIITKSMESTHHNRKRTALGIFFYIKSEKGYESVAFPYNADDLDYQTGQGYYDVQTGRLYFTSNRPDSHGGNDLYYSEWNDEKWQEPVHLDHPINTSKDEIFPNITAQGDLVFASQQGNSGDFDLFIARWNGTHFGMPQRLGTPFNSEADDIQLIYTQGNEQGFLVSNRNQSIDEVYAFYQARPEFKDCSISDKPIFCYLFEETTIVPNDTMPMLYEWAFSDGQKANGLKVQHCFEKIGSHSAMLNVYDSTTKVLYANLSEIQLDIQKSQLPYIESTQGSTVDSSMHFMASGSEIDSFQVKEVHWQFGDNGYEQGMEVYHRYKQAGTFECQLLMIGTTPDGQMTSKCASKNIQIVGLAEPSVVTDPEAIQPLNSLAGSFKSTVRDSVLYFVEFKQSDIPIAQNDPYFANIHYEITERISSQDSMFHYSVGAEKDFTSTLPILQDLKSNGYLSSIIKDQEVEQNKIAKIKNWWFMPDSIESALNKQMNKFSDIKFETGSWTISEQSYDEIAYIAKVIKSQPMVSLEIIAHTDSIGSASNNQILSEKRARSVADLLTAEGIESKRLITIGLGESQSNLIYANRKSLADDRRVEFRILRK